MFELMLLQLALVAALCITALAIYCEGRFTTHWRYLSYVVRHKWYVGRECFRHGLYWQGLVHDWQKFCPSEWFPYVQYYYGGNPPPCRIGEAIEDRFAAAWLHHQHRGPHHWQYWVLQNDDGTQRALKMPEKYAREMLCDWTGASLAIHGHDNINSWYDEHERKMILHPETRAWVEEELETQYYESLMAYYEDDLLYEEWNYV